MKIKIVVGELLFVFSSERDWISTAQIKFRNVGHTAASVVCVDKAGMVCTRGKHFRLAQYNAFQCPAGPGRGRHSVLSIQDRTEAAIAYLDGRITLHQLATVLNKPSSATIKWVGSTLVAAYRAGLLVSTLKGKPGAAA